MCGICGIFNFDSRIVEIDKLKKITKRMHFRGPDDEGFFVDKNFGMGMRRLAIIDVDKGNQPISDNEMDVHIILNGEIYNYLELKKELLAKGHT